MFNQGNKKRRIIIISIVGLLLLGIATIITVYILQRRQVSPTESEASYTLPYNDVNGTLADYWAGNAEWKLVEDYTKLRLVTKEGDYVGAGTQIVPVGDTWYLFSRQVLSEKCEDGINNKLGTNVRISTNKGLTWSNPQIIIAPAAGSNWPCAGIDQSAYFDAETQKWEIIFQCGKMLKNANNVYEWQWNTCHIRSNNADPRQGFYEPHTNPIAKDGDFWKRICTNSSKDCYNFSQVNGVNKVRNEGTFDIFEKKSGYFYVAFHGFDIEKNLGYRGIGRTQDFVTWQLGNENSAVPADAVLDKVDSANWRESWGTGGKIGSITYPAGSIGFGHGSIIYENGYYYMIAESSDYTLDCIDDQNWDMGLYRSNNITKTTWESFPGGNPIYYSSRSIDPRNNNSTKKNLRCNVQYFRLFKDPQSGAIYMHVSRDTNMNLTELGQAENGVYLYKLVKTGNLLKNSDFWKCATDDWQKSSGSNINFATYRMPKETTDGNCFAQISCTSGNCQGGLTQNMNLIGVNQLTFGGRIKGSAKKARVNIVLYEYDNNNNLLATNYIEISTDTTYRTYSKSIYTKSRTRKVTLYVTPFTKNVIYNLDEMFVYKK